MLGYLKPAYVKTMLHDVNQTILVKDLLHEAEAVAKPSILTWRKYGAMTIVGPQDLLGYEDAVRNTLIYSRTFS
jgi:hypothetical protein